MFKKGNPKGNPFGFSERKSGDAKSNPTAQDDKRSIIRNVFRKRENARKSLSPRNAPPCENLERARAGRAWVARDRREAGARFSRGMVRAWDFRGTPYQGPSINK